MGEEKVFSPHASPLGTPLEMVSSDLRTSILGSHLSHLTVRSPPRQSSPHGIVSCTVREHVNANSRPTPAIPSEVREGDSLQELDF